MHRRHIGRKAGARKTVQKSCKALKGMHQQACWGAALQACGNAVDGFQKYKAPQYLSVPGRLGSPPPELPNHAWILGFGEGSVNVTSVIRSAGGGHHRHAS